MVDVGDVIENPVTGERITFVRASEQTGGAIAEMDLELRPTAFLAAEDIHRSQEEKFQVLEGHILLRCGGEDSISGPGTPSPYRLAPPRPGRRTATPPPESASPSPRGRASSNSVTSSSASHAKAASTGEAWHRCRPPPASASSTTCTSPAHRYRSNERRFGCWPARTVCSLDRNLEVGIGPSGRAGSWPACASFRSFRVCP
jgi:hypothetical protein